MGLCYGVRVFQGGSKRRRHRIQMPIDREGASAGAGANRGARRLGQPKRVSCCWLGATRVSPSPGGGRSARAPVGHLGQPAGSAARGAPRRARRAAPRAPRIPRRGPQPGGARADSSSSHGTGAPWGGLHEQGARGCARARFPKMECVGGSATEHAPKGFSAAGLDNGGAARGAARAKVEGLTWLQVCEGGPRQAAGGPARGRACRAEPLKRGRARRRGG
ncbi:MAG: hypothetical protein J3K34DRAFT_76577 [Monoraphidium minutum]|nr:MAG: hypothetical protein J3K34DRAFT_76577 [Monoraphidium minutum]